VAGAAFDAEEHSGCYQGNEGEHQHHRRDRYIPEGDKDEDRERRQHRNRHLRHILAKKGLQLLDTINDRQHHAAGALASEPGRAQRRNLVVKAAA